jgi:hypothetical protein
MNMADLRGFDANQVEPSTAFDPIPAGKYLAVITESTMEPNSAGNGSFLKLVFEIVEGEHKGRLVWERLNVNHPNETAVRIANAKLSAICRAVRVMAPQDSEQLHNLPLVIKVRCRKRKDIDEITNEISGYEPREALSGVPQQSQSNTPPWRRK